MVFPGIIKADFVVGGGYGEGALKIGGKTVDYYSTAAASFGFQIGAQSKSLVIVFMTDETLKPFRNSINIDGSAAVIECGVVKDINTVNIKDPIIGFVSSNKGLMYNLTLEGSKFTKL